MDYITALLYSTFTVFLGMCLFVAYRYAEPGRAKTALMVVVGMWFLILASRTVSFIFIDGLHSSVVPMSLGFKGMVSGAICFFIFLLYPVLIIDPKLLNSAYAKLSPLPLLLTIIAYIVYHKCAGLPLDAAYTAAEMWELRHTATVIFRLVLVSVFILTIVVTIINIYGVIPSYQEYINCNYADSSYNIIWLRNFMTHISAISIVYFIYAFYQSPITAIVYLLVICPIFVVAVDSTIMHKMSDMPEGLRLTWSFKRRWHFVYEGSGLVNAAQASNVKINEFFKWVEQNKPYADSDFSMSRVVDHFPELDFAQINEVLKEQGLNFQSYVRKCRIEEAERIISVPGNELSHKEIAFKVGFSHYSSFSRAFVAVTGHAPTTYAER